MTNTEARFIHLEGLEKTPEALPIATTLSCDHPYHKTGFGIQRLTPDRVSANSASARMRTEYQLAMSEHQATGCSHKPKITIKYGLTQLTNSSF